MVQNANVPVALTEEEKAMLNEGIDSIFSRWTAVQAAVNCGWGGRDSRAKYERTMANVFEHFTLSKDAMDSYKLKDILEEGLDDLNTVAADGSVDEVKKNLQNLYEECCVGNYQTVEALRVAKSQTTASVTKVSDDNDEESSDEDEDTYMNNNETTDMMVDASEHSSNQKSEAMPVDDDGWTVVSSRKNKGKKIY